jgi:DNA replication and repair protein RecF
VQLSRLAATGFRNLVPFDLAIGDAAFVVWHGPNGQGKTNALEVVYWLGALKPWRASRSRELVTWGETSARAAASLGSGHVARVEQSAAGRRVLLDDRPVADLADYFDAIRVIAFCPADAEIVQGEPARRRAWLDRAAFTAAPAHLAVARAFRRVLDQKSALLRSVAPDPLLLDTLDSQLATSGAVLVERRAALLADLSARVAQAHRSIAGEADVALTLKTAAPGVDRAARVAALAERLAAARAEELRRRTPLAGPQSDDVAITLDGRQARGFASRGQVRSLVLALKLAVLEAARDRGDVPLFLLDDASSELDAVRTARVVAALADLSAQVFATTTAPAHLGALPADRTLWIAVEEGRQTPGTDPRSGS